MKNLLLGISTANNHLLKEGSIDVALNLCIAELGKCQNVDRCYIFKNEDKKGKYRSHYQYEWCNNDVEAYIGNPELDDHSTENLPGIYEVLRKDQSLFGLVKESKNDYFKEILEMQGIKSYLFTPIFSENIFWGWIGYDDCKTERTWLEEEVSALHSVAKNIGIRLNQDKIKAKLDSHLEQFNFYLKGSNQGMWEWDILSGKTNFSYNWSGMLGYTAEEIEQNENFWQESIHKEEIEETQKKFKQYTTGETNNYEGINRIKHKDGHYVWMKYSGLVIKDKDGKPIKIIGSHIDISEIKEKELELEISEEKFRFIAENTTDLICQHRDDGSFTYVSKSSKEIIGYSPEELIHKNPYDYIHSQEVKKVIKSHKEIIKNLKPSTISYRFRKKNNDYIWLETTSKVIVNNKNEVIGMQSSSRDISARMKFTDELKLNLLKEKELNEMKSKFVAMASHQFKTPLTIIYSNAELLEIKSNKWGDVIYKQVELISSRIKNEVNRLTQLMNNILIFGEHELVENKTIKKTIDFELLINKTIENYFSNEKNGRKISLLIEGEKRLLITDETLLSHILTNIISNAFKYSENKRDPFILVNYLKNSIKIEITDFGIGIPEDDMQHLFTSFFRATNTSTIIGSGLGLTIAKQFTSLINGDISIKSKENSGTTITLIFPYE